MPIGLVMITLEIRIVEGHRTGYAGEAGSAAARYTRHLVQTKANV